MKTESSAQAFIATSFIPRLNSNLCLPLVEKCGGIEGFFEESDKALSSLYKTLHISANLFDRKTALTKAKKEMAEIEKHDIRICSIEHHHYPELLKQCEDAPLVFYYKGKFTSPDSNKYLAIVGTRHASSRCQTRVENLIAELCALNFRPVIVSGLAYGIDASAHRASLKHGLPTFAVLGHGLHMIYPASHKNLAENILNSGGALLSEFPCTAPIHPVNFLRRNRIIAGLCHATLIAESAQKGGAMSTARLALSYNREVMALPGRPEDPYSSGCNLLIKENTAALIDNATDIARILNFPISREHPQQIHLEFFDTSEKETILLAVLKEHGDTHIDELHQCMSIPPGELSALLLQLELEGKILALPGKKYALAN
ncbi:DNA-processing protein DprA [Odoribacter sp. Z80]|uniref:DNA-processing protein DprA n=1 Tax=Odoribacter sp. Z80 TaxID=2304575 RepID=UPI00137967B5|nr:DNA-processing protein DprA [Odoribacter sp. Z80]NCE72525.1 DNA-protecting protein DprA [Odoribacter sp. Z80]